MDSAPLIGWPGFLGLLMAFVLLMLTPTVLNAVLTHRWWHRRMRHYRRLDGTSKRREVRS